ncbi:MAG: response regulator [Herminiimonas sp.]|nr:response regulator [Herminiimonas sp.]
MFADVVAPKCRPSPVIQGNVRPPPPPISRIKRNPPANISSKPHDSPIIRSATPAQRRFATTVCVAMVAVTVLLLPFAQTPWPTIQAFLPMYQTAIIGACLITAFLMYAHYEGTRSLAVLHLSASYLYTAGVLVMQLLSFPGAFIKGEQIFGGPQTTIWLWVFWHVGPALGVLSYAWTEYRHPALTVANYNAALLRTAIGLFCALGATALLVAVFHDQLPVLDIDGDYSAITSTGIAPVLQVVLAAALLCLWRASRFRNVVHVWLGIVLVALLCDNAITMVAGNRLSLGWYVGRFGALIASTVMMLVYLYEIFASYQRSMEKSERLAHSNAQLDSDIVRRKHYEEMLRKTDRRKDEFLAMLAHELRNPLAPISAAAELLSRVSMDEVQIKQTSEIIARQVKHITDMVDDLLDVSRITKGLAELESAPLDIRSVVSDAVEQVSPLIQSRRHHLILHLSPDASTLLGDRKRLLQVIANLLINAAKYTNEGGNIHLKTRVEQDRVVLRVEDDGIGMAPAMVARVFDMFAQAERKSDRSTGGLGLGLALVKSLVELHGGNVSCASQGLGKGSQFTVSLPRVADPIDNSHQIKKEPGVLASSKPLHIMVVDDNVDAAQLLGMFLEASGHEVIIAHGPRQALERATLESPDVFLVDVGLPEMDGNELAYRLRLQSESTKAVLIAVSGYDQDADRKRSLDAGFNHYMVKPIDMAKLATLLGAVHGS